VPSSTELADRFHKCRAAKLHSQGANLGDGDLVRSCGAALRVAKQRIPSIELPGCLLKAEQRRGLIHAIAGKV
jgi:hypothetical protein